MKKRLAGMAAKAKAAAGVSSVQLVGEIKRLSDDGAALRQSLIDLRNKLERQAMLIGQLVDNGTLSCFVENFVFLSRIAWSCSAMQSFAN